MDFKSAPVIENETERLKAVNRTGAMYIEQDTLYEIYCFLAKEITGCPVSWTGLIDNKYQYCLASDGMPQEFSKKIPRQQTFCQFALSKTEPLIIENMLKDERFINHPLVKNRVVKFYAAFPIVTGDGYTLGTLCVSHNKVIRLSKNKIQLLVGLTKKLAYQLQIQENFKNRNAENLLEILNKISKKLKNVSTFQIKIILKFFLNHTLNASDKDFLVEEKLAEYGDNIFKITEFGNELKNDLTLNTGVLKRVKNMTSKNYDLSEMFDKFKE